MKGGWVLLVHPGAPGTLGQGLLLELAQGSAA